MLRTWTTGPLKGAEKAGVSLKEFTDMFYNSFMEDLDSLEHRQGFRVSPAE